MFYKLNYENDLDNYYEVDDLYTDDVDDVDIDDDDAYATDEECDLACSRYEDYYFNRGE